MAHERMDRLLGEVYEFRSGLSKPASEFGSGHPFLTFKDVFYNYFVPDTLGDLVNSTDADRDAGDVKRGDVFLTRTSETMEELGMSCVALRDVPFSTFNGFSKRLRPKPGSPIVPEYAGYFFRSPQFRREVTAMSSMSTRSSLNNDILGRLRITLPDVVTQAAIGATLKSLDDKIKQNRETAQALEHLARAIFQAWFVDFEPVKAKAAGATSFPSMPQPVFDALPTRVVDSDIGPVPEGWEVGVVADLCDHISSGGTPGRMNSRFWAGGTIDWFKTGELHDGPLLESLEQITKDGLDNSSCKIWPVGTVLFALYASPTVGRLGVLTRPGASNQAAAGLIARSEVGTPYLMHALLEARTYLQRVAVGSAQQNINQAVLKSHALIVPPSLLTTAYSSAMVPLLALQVALAREGKQLATMRDYLLPKLLSGEMQIYSFALEETT